MLLQLHVWSLYLLQEGGDIGWDPRSLWGQMGPLAKFVVVGFHHVGLFDWRHD